MSGDGHNDRQAILRLMLHPCAGSSYSLTMAGPETTESQPEMITLAEAAETLGVHYMTAYRYVRLGRLKAEKVGVEWRIQPEDLAAFSTDQPPKKRALTEDELLTLRPTLIAALVAGDEAKAWEVVEPLLDQATDTTMLHTGLLGPAMADIGEAWAKGQLSITDEHRATVVVRRILGRSRPWFRGPGRRRGMVVVGAPESDHHALPTAMFADLVRANGPDAIDLGAQTPASTFSEVVQRSSGGLVVAVVVTNDHALREAQQCAAAVREAGPAVPVVVGGYAVKSRSEAELLGATHWAASSREGAELVVELLAG